jgi:hypothetical protein
MSSLLLLLHLATENGEIRAVHAAQITATAFLGIDYVRGMIAFGVKSGGKG